MHNKNAAAGPAATKPTTGTFAITEPIRLPRSEHTISRQDISSATLKVLYGLKDAGYEGYLVGGAVRDLLAGIEPKDFDVATDAHPDRIRAAFRSCRLVGRRFLIAHVRFGDEIIEVTTFRGPIGESHERDETGRILSDNIYGTLEEDAFRRDFTINGLYYDIRDFAIVDYVGGIADLKARKVRMIGDPEERYREDPVRMLRAVRIANKLGFDIEESTAREIPHLAPLLGEIPPARLFEEVLKLFLSREALTSFRLLRKLALFREMFPQVEAQLSHEQMSVDFVEQALEGTATRLAKDLPVSPSFLYAALLWPAVKARSAELSHTQGHPEHVALAQAAEEVMARQVLRVAIPKRFSIPAREIWTLQPRFEQTKGGRAKRLLSHPRFRAAYDFMLLRSRAGEVAQSIADWWTAAQNNAPGAHDADLADLPDLPDELAEPGDAGAAAPSQPRRRRRRRRRGGSKPAA